MKDMKKIFYILAGALLCATACQREAFNEGNGRSTTVPPSAGSLAALEFSVDFPESGIRTRAEMGESNIPSTLYIAVFGEEGGYLQNWIPATLVREVVPTEAGMKITYIYKAYLPINTNEIFHFIGDSPTTSPTFEYEKDFIHSLVTNNKQGAFWQRVIVKGGVAAKKNSDGTYDLDDNGNYKIDLNANGYNDTDKKNPLRHVVLIRNFAKIDVQSGDSHFNVLQWALVNVPVSGTVAPYSGQTSGDVQKFNVPYTSILDYLPESEGGSGLHKLGTFYDDLVLLTESGYTGYYGTFPSIVSTATPTELKPEDMIDQSEPTSFKQSTDSDPGLYMYERPVPDLMANQPPTRLLVQLEWISLPDGASGITEGAKQWYLIDVLDEKGEYMPILRNIKYKMYLSGIDEGGYSTSSLAFNGNVYGNVSTALETSTLNEITVGDAKIYVQKLDFTFFNHDETNTTLEFEYYPNKNEAPVYVSDPETVPDPERTKIVITLKNVPGYEPAIKSLSHIAGEENPTIVTKLNGAEDGIIPITMYPSGANMRKSIIRVQGSVGEERPIFREVVYTVMENPSFTDETTVSSLATDASGQSVTVTIGLPEGLTSDMFPLQVCIEAENNCLSTTNPDIPVKDAVSTFEAGESDQAGKRTFYYIYTIKYSQYYHPTQETQYTYTFDCVFQTTKSSGNKDTKIKISDAQGRFNSVIKELKVGSGS